MAVLVGTSLAHAPITSAHPAGRTAHSFSGAALTADHPNLKIQAQAAADTFVAGDYKKFVTLVYPKLVKMVGGSDAMLDLITKGMRDTDAKGFKLISYTIGEPEPAIQIEQALYAIVPTKMRMQSPYGVVASESFMIGISTDGGENWTFLGGAGATDEAQLKMVLPEVVGKLKLPEKKEPVLERKQ